MKETLGLARPAAFRPPLRGLGSTVSVTRKSDRGSHVDPGDWEHHHEDPDAAIVASGNCVITGPRSWKARYGPSPLRIVVPAPEAISTSVSTSPKTHALPPIRILPPACWVTVRNSLAFRLTDIETDGHMPTAGPRGASRNSPVPANLTRCTRIGLRCATPLGRKPTSVAFPRLS
jgi:hypothetical protein